MTTLVEIPGVGEVEFPDSMSEQEINSAIQKMVAPKQQLAQPMANPTPTPPDAVTVPIPGTQAHANKTLGVPDPSVTDAAARGFTRQLLDNLLAIPEVAADLGFQALAPRDVGLNPAQGQRFDPISVAAQGMKTMTGGAVDPAAAAARERQRLAQGGQVIDMPSAAEVSAGTDVALSLGQRGYDEALERQQATDIRFGEEAPISTGVGEVGGDIATLALTRGMGRGAATGAMMPAKTAQVAPVVAQNAQTILGRAIQGTGKALMRAGGRAAETGAEAAFLAALQDSDPATVGASAAGIQALGDLTRPTFLRLIKPNNLLKAIAVTTVASLGVQQLTPGGLDRILPTLEGKNKEAVIALLLSGSVGGLTGRVSKDFAGPAFAELTSLIPRGVLESTLSSIAKDPARTVPILTKFSENPDYFGPKAKRLLTRALTVEGASLDRTVNSLMDERSFRRQVEALQAQ